MKCIECGTSRVRITEEYDSFFEEYFEVAVCPCGARYNPNPDVEQQIEVMEAA